ncbi:MAG: transcriptional regulator [Cytophagales bacterium CG12_big_fil_rev_8_21_14_0_65_40_12]|nr:MAG: transcriptional regulator [Cytophagales bacterium CG12_big_fil_rev_8_21_14_0_65_40_12]PIW04300.1 MAG: transcriptional regulator [Cytophagales bacterium CG17_big_fil_post_rev_8_21_14_2_50_40_13]
MMVNTSNDWLSMTDKAILIKIGAFIKQMRLAQNKTQSQIATEAGLNRWTVSQAEKGESITLASLVQLLRALDALYVLGQFNFEDEISPLAYAKLKKDKRKRARPKDINQVNDNGDLGW